MRVMTAAPCALLVFFGLTLAAPAGAQTQRPAPAAAKPAASASASAPKVEYKKMTVYDDFDADLVEGTLASGDGSLLTVRGRSSHRSLIQPRQSFVPEIILSADR